ncbi:hypothetical protein EVAR_66733_1 [Eumeta japonica]|uniref:Uncharacterized protein n=1 Tax=Eumeta variegata TaxID=151549 RepID=A0A4C1T7U4_EUMVA|nr:hypothetical protein EVAR_66733_1 [Eumeta japonica]
MHFANDVEEAYGAEVTLRPDGAYRVPSTTTAIIIHNCARVYFLSNTVENLTSLRNIDLRNNSHVYFNERSISWSPYQREHELSNPGLSITIENCTMNDVASYAFKGRIDDITITKSRINVIRPFAFSSLTGVKLIELTNNLWDNIEIQTFKKFSTVNFILRGGEIKNIPSRFLSDVEITNLLWMDGVNVLSISSIAFLANSPKRVLIENNIVGNFEGDAFHIATRGPVTFRNNTVFTLGKGSLLGFSVERDIISNYGLQELSMDNNTITDLGPLSLLHNRTTFMLRVDSLNLNASCSCELFEEWEELITQQGAINCWYTLEVRFVSIRSYVENKCGPIQQNLWIIISVVGILLLIILIAIFIVIVQKRRKEKRKLPIVMPDGKTYKETVIETIVERAELLTTDL